MAGMADYYKQLGVFQPTDPYNQANGINTNYGPRMLTPPTDFVAGTEADQLSQLGMGAVPNNLGGIMGQNQPQGMSGFQMGQLGLGAIGLGEGIYDKYFGQGKDLQKAQLQGIRQQTAFDKDKIAAWRGHNDAMVNAGLRDKSVYR